MAIEKSKTLPNGATGNYWRITSITLNRQNLTAIAEIALFKDKSTSDAGHPPLGAYKTFNFNFTVPALVSSQNVIAFIYGLIVARAETVVAYNFFTGEPLAEPTVVDPDIAGGTQVL